MSYARQQQILEDMNYANDHRVRANDKWFESFDEKKMAVSITLWDEDDCDEEVWIPVKFEVCETCGGKGTHVNPSIDSNGLTAEDFDEDPGFQEEYFSGSYDQTCNACDGKRVFPVVDKESADPEVIKRIDDLMQDRADDHAERMAEMRMGC